MTGSQQLILGEGAGGSGVANYIEDVFSTWLYTGNGSTQTITNGIDVTGKGGLIWFKERASQGFDHALVDTARGNLSSTEGYSLASNQTAAQSSVRAVPTSSGFSLSSGSGAGPVNFNGSTYVSWTFRKQPKFFDVVTYTGNSTSGRTVAHNLGSVPGCIIVKAYSGADASTANWAVYHRSLGNGYWLRLENTGAALATGNLVWTTTAPTSTEFSVGSITEVNKTGNTYVAYLFAHDAGGFGLTGADNVISCGSYTGNGSATGPTVTLGYEPQWVLIKNATFSGAGWLLFDNMRGMTVTDDAALLANTSGSEFVDQYIAPTATGFNVQGTYTAVNGNGDTMVYIAIRRGPMKTPTTGTSVFQADTYSGTGASGRSLTTLSAIYLSIIKWRTGNPFGDGWSWSDRLRGIRQLASNSTASETNHPDHLSAFGPNQNTVTLGNGGTVNGSGMTYVNYAFQRAPGFFDVVCYTGNGTAGTAISHNLGVVPELVITKKRSAAASWYSLYQPSMRVILLNNSNGYLDASLTKFYFGNNSADVSPTASTFTVASDADINQSGATYVAYLFASVAGVSKVGSYTGTGALQTINCGFTGGARFVLIKRTDSAGSWYVYDSARGISSGNDPYLLLNGTAAEVTNTNYVDTTSVGFQVTAAAPADLNANGGTYIFLAVS